jgi:penicillin-binding protein activator
MKSYLAPAFLLLYAAFAGCSSTRYGDPEGVETVNADWGSTDLQIFSKKMVQSLIDAPELAYLSGPAKGSDQRIIAYMGGVRNETSEHINTEAVTDSIRTELLQSRRFRFVADPHGQDEVGEQVRFQQDSGRVNPEMAKKFGKQLGADVVIYGALRSIEKRKGRSLESAGTKLEDVYYQFVLNCVNLETGEIIWSDKGEIRKTQRTGAFG